MTNTINQSNKPEKTIFYQVLQEIYLIPREQQENLLHLIQTFRQAITQKNNEIKVNAIEQNQQAQIEKNQAILELLEKWEAEGYEQEQTETLTYLQDVLS